MKRLAIVTNRRLDTIESGNGAYLRTFFEHALGLGFQVTIITAPSTAFGNLPFARIAPAFADRAEMVWPGSVRVGDKYWSLSPGVWIRSAWRLAVEPLRRLGLVRISGLLSHVPREGELAPLARAVRAAKPDVVVVEYSSLGPLLARLTDIPKRGVLLHDLFSSRAAAFKAAGRPLDHLDMTLAEEVARCSGATFLLHASHNELAHYAPLAPSQRHVWLAPSAPLRREALTRRAPFVAFFGVNHAGNVDALDHMLEAIWPRVLARKPDARFCVAGGICALYAGRTLPAGVELLGRLPSLDAFAGPDAIGVAPTRVGSGVSIKVAEYLGLGMPVVAYSGGVEGFGALLEGAVEVVADADAFAARLVDLLNDADARAARSAKAMDTAERALVNTPVTEALTA